MPSHLLSIAFFCLSATTLFAQTPSFRIPRTNTATYGTAARNKSAISRRDAAKITDEKTADDLIITINKDDDDEFKAHEKAKDVTKAANEVKTDTPLPPPGAATAPNEVKEVKTAAQQNSARAKAVAKAQMAQKKAENEFKTPEIIEYKYQERTKMSKMQKLESLRSDLYVNAEGSDAKKQYPKDTILQKFKAIKALEKEIGQINDQTDSLFYLYTRDYMQYKNATVLSFGQLRSRAFFDMLYGSEGKQFKALGNAGINFGTNTASIYSELVSGNLGTFRISLGSMISSSNNKDPLISKKEEAFQRLVTYGGNTVLTAEYPLAYIHSNDNRQNFIARLMTKGTSDLPVFGTNTESFAGSGSLGTDFYADAATSNNAIRFFANANINGIYGTDVYKNNLGISSNYFGFGQASLGIIFLENFKISFIVYTFSTEDVLRNRNIVAGGQILR
jgi:hypothetical protein